VAVGDSCARRIYETIGVWFGYTIAHCADFYDIRNLLVLGRVMSGEGGDLILQVAGKVLKDEFPEVEERIRIHIPGEQERRHGQAIAAASLPAIM
jgi:predicted NBD/HSP70 family sugar kinase